MLNIDQVPFGPGSGADNELTSYFYLLLALGITFFLIYRMLR